MGDKNSREQMEDGIMKEKKVDTDKEKEARIKEKTDQLMAEAGKAFDVIYH